MFLTMNEALKDLTRTIAYHLRGIFLAAVIALFALLAEQSNAADSLAGPMPIQGVQVPRDETPTAEEIATLVYSRFHVGWHDALEIGQAVLNSARRYTISPLLLLSVIAVESSFDRFAVSVVGATGLMQVLPSQHKDRVLRKSDLTDTQTNVRIGSAILQDYIRESDGNLEEALYRYSGGAKGYVRRVVDHMSMMKAEFGL